MLCQPNKPKKRRQRRSFTFVNENYCDGESQTEENVDKKKLFTFCNGMTTMGKISSQSIENRVQH